MLALYSSSITIRIPLFTLQACCRVEILAVEFMSNMHQTVLSFSFLPLKTKKLCCIKSVSQNCMIYFSVSPFSCQSWVLGPLIMSQLPRTIWLLRWQKVSSSITTLSPTFLFGDPVWLQSYVIFIIFLTPSTFTPI